MKILPAIPPALSIPTQSSQWRAALSGAYRAQPADCCRVSAASLVGVPGVEPGRYSSPLLSQAYKAQPHTSADAELVARKGITHAPDRKAPSSGPAGDQFNLSC